MTLLQNKIPRWPKIQIAATRRVVLFVFLVLLLSWTPPGQAQLVNGTVTGSVLDDSGAVIIGATVRLTNTGTAITQVATTDENGNFRFLLLTSGSYRVDVASPGFRSFLRDGITVEAGRSLAIPVRLSVGAVTETIEVAGGTPLLDPNTSTLGSIIDSKKVEDLPLNGRNPMGLANLIPTVRGIGYFGGQVLSTWRLAAVNIGGGDPLKNDFMIDGMANTKLGGGEGPMTFLAADGTQEFKIETNAMSAEYGRTSGGVMNLVSKSGTNEYHGSLFEYFRADDLNANEFFANRSGNPRQPLTVNQFGGTVGGPIVKEKLFFFFNYEKFLERRTSVTTLTSPTRLERSGDFSQTLNQGGSLIKIYDPYTTMADPSNPSKFLRSAFGGNVIPESRLSPVSKAVMGYFPEGNIQGLPNTNAQNLFAPSGNPIDKDALGIKFDYSLNSNRRLAFRYSWDSLDWLFPCDFKNIAGSDCRQVYVPRHSVMMSYSDALSPTLLLDGRIGFNREFENYATPSNGFDVTTIGMPASVSDLVRGPGADEGVFPRFSITDAATFGGREAQYGASITGTAALSLTKIQGSHSLKIGWQYRQYLLNRSLVASSASGSYAFNRSFTQGPDPLRPSSTGGYGVATFMLGTPTSGSITTPTFQSFQLKNQALFVQDDWKVTPKLTLNLGLRWEYEGPPTERYNRLSNFDPDIASPLTVPGLPLTGGLVYAGEDGRDRGYIERDFNDWGPRFGFAYQATSKMVIRGGYGIMFIPSTGVEYAQDGYSRQTTMVTSLDGGLTPVDTLSNPFPNGIEQPFGSALGALTGVGANITGGLRNEHRGYSQQWNYTVQYSPWDGWLFEGAWVANHGSRLYMRGRQMNFLTADALELGTGLAQSVPNPFYGLIETGILSGPTITRQQLEMQFPQFTGVNTQYSFVGNSIYHALALKVEKRFSGGLSMLMAYTKSKQLDDFSTGSVRPGANSSIGIQDWGNLRAERSRTANDIPQRMVLTLLWELPFGKEGSSLKKNLLGGWQINSINTIESGAPLSLSASVTGPGNRPNVVDGVDAKLDKPTLERWFNTDAFSQPAPYTFGNASRTLPNVSTDGVFNMDLSLLKNISISEKTRLQFRAEAFNLTNSPTFAAPGSALNSATFGRITATAFNPKPREIQLGLVLRF